MGSLGPGNECWLFDLYNTSVDTHVRDKCAAIESFPSEEARRNSRRSERESVLDSKVP